MTTHYRIALLGFSPFERNTLGSCLRLASTRQPRYDQVQMLTEADFVIADADHAPSVQLVLAVERLPETVFVGSRAPEGAIAWLQRPIDPMRVLRELDIMAARRIPAAVPVRGGQAAAVEATRKRTVIQPVRPQRPEPPPHLLHPAPEALDLTLPDMDLPGGATPSALAPAPAVARASEPDLPVIGARRPAATLAEPTPNPGTPAIPPAPAPSASASVPVAAAKPAVAAAPMTSRSSALASSVPSTALLVDDSEIALRFLERKLAPFGLVTESVSHSQAAVERLASRRYDFVFLDMELGERSPLDGLGLCQHIKREPSAANVVMVTAHHTELDRVRGALAGCDGFLGKPLDEEELALYLARFGVRPAANAGSAPS